MHKVKNKILIGFFAIIYFLSGVAAPTFANRSYTYDANGNMSSDGAYCYTYNDANQVSQVKDCASGQTIAQYVYDYQGNRIVKKNYVSGTLNNTVYSPDDGYETKKLANNTTQNTSYYYVNSDLVAKKNPDGSKNYYLSDNLNSTSVLTDQSGNVVENTTYYPFGDIRSGGTKSKYLYTGQENDPETGLDYYNARYYNSHIRRFTQPDNIIADPYNPQNLNRYSYVNNNPLTHNDPTGHCIEDLCIGESIVLGAVISATAPELVSAGGSIVHDIQNHDIAHAVDTASWFVPGVSEEKLAVEGEAKVSSLVAREVIHGNDLRNTATTIGYTLRDITTGAVKKFGETTRGVARYTQKFYKENNVRLQEEARGTKAEMHLWQHKEILKFVSKAGKRPPLNKSNW